VQRVYYVPQDLEVTQEHLNEAESLGVNVLHGESALSRYVDFDRDNAQVISLPTERLCFFLPTVEFPMHQIIEITNDFIDLRDEVVLVLNGSQVVKPTVLEKHFARYVIQSVGLGIQVFDVFDKGMQVIEHGQYEVANPE
jgi:hypothetical protein